MVKVLFAVSLTGHTLLFFLLCWVAVVGVALSSVWGGEGRIAPIAAICMGVLVTCVGHVGLLTRLAHSPGDRLRLASIVALPAGWILAALVAIVTVAGASP